MRWTFLVPELPVRDVRAAHEWYRNVLVRKFALRDPDGNVLRIGTGIDTEPHHISAEISFPGRVD